MSSNSAPEKAKDLFNKHEKTLQDATRAIHSREFYAAYPEPPSRRIYGEESQANGEKAFQAQLKQNFTGLIQDNDGFLRGRENSPYTREDLGVCYPYLNDVADYVGHAQSATKAWRDTDPAIRAGILTESLERIRDRFFEIAYATQHTTGQAFVMAFQASGPHSNDRALEAISLGLYELQRFPDTVDWKKPMGKDKEGNPRFVELKKRFKKVPMGVSLAIGCSTFPVWNTVPGVYASLVTGNTVILKPHPLSIYPIAIVAAELQATLKEYGYDHHIVQMAIDTPDAPITKELAENPGVKIIDYTGGNLFGDYIENLPGKRTFTEKSGINSIVIESTNNLRKMMQNIAFSASLYSGQMCTCPQNIFIPKEGIMDNGVNVSYEDTVAALTEAINGLVNNEKMGPGTLGAIQNDTTFNRVKEAETLGYKVALESQIITNPEFPNARIIAPAVIEVPAEKQEVYEKEMFGPVVFVIQTENTDQSIDLAKQLASRHGAITFGAYTQNNEIMDKMIEEISSSYTSMSFNFMGPIWMNQSAGFSDFHVSGGNPAGNASLTDPEFVLGRFEIVGVRIHP